MTATKSQLDAVLKAAEFLLGARQDQMLTIEEWVARVATMLRTRPRARMLTTSSRRSSAVMLSGSRVESAGIGVVPWATRESLRHYGCPMPCACAMRGAITTGARSRTALFAQPRRDPPDSSRYDSGCEHRPQDRHPAEPAIRRRSA